MNGEKISENIIAVSAVVFVASAAGTMVGYCVRAWLDVRDSLRKPKEQPKKLPRPAAVHPVLSDVGGKKAPLKPAVRPKIVDTNNVNPAS